MSTFIPRPVKRGTPCPTRQDLSPAHARQLNGNKCGDALEGSEPARRSTAMSSTSANHARNILHNGRGAPTPNERVSSRARGPSSQVGPHEWPSTSSPRSPASGHRPQKSASDLGRASTGRDIKESRSERVHVTIADKVTIRTRSPLKEPRHDSASRDNRDTPMAPGGDVVLASRSPARSSDRECSLPTRRDI